MSRHAYAEGPSAERGEQKWLAYKLGILGLNRGNTYEGRHRLNWRLNPNAVFYHSGYRIWYRTDEGWAYEEIR